MTLPGGQVIHFKGRDGAKRADDLMREMGEDAERTAPTSVRLLFPTVLRRWGVTPAAIIEMAAPPKPSAKRASAARAPLRDSPPSQEA
jgi:hypothetical protein